MEAGERAGMKILFLDIDDTLLNRKREISDRNREAIQRAVDAGHKVVICSGRPLLGVMPIVKDLGLTREGCYAISFNGAQIYDCYRQKTLLRKTLTMDQVRMLFEEAEKEGIHIQTYDEQDTVLVKEEDEEILSYCDKVNIAFRVEPHLPEALTAEPVKCLLLDLKSHERLEHFRKMIEERDEAVNLFFSNPSYLECVSAGISKGEAVRWFCGYMQVPIEDSVSAGDSENDLSMLEAAGVGCAMANATDACKAAADYITEADCDHSGVAEIIEKFLLNGQ